MQFDTEKSMEKAVEPASECYAFLLDDEGGDIDSFIDYEERVIEIAVEAIPIGELDGKQVQILYRRCRKEFATKKYPYSIRGIKDV